jgi:L-amino acid N-acyltransferase YncA
LKSTGLRLGCSEVILFEQRMTTTKTIIRSADAADMGAITTIYHHHVRHGLGTFETDPPDCLEMERRRGEILRCGLPFLVAELDGLVMGYAYAAQYRARAAYRFTVEDSIYIHPSYVGQGLGRVLLPRLIELCTVQGCRQMVAVIGDSQNERSIRLHTSLGFRMVGVFENVGFKFDRWVDTVLMQRKLAVDVH